MRTEHLIMILALLLAATACSQEEAKNGGGTTTTAVAPLTETECGATVPRARLSTLDISTESEARAMVASHTYPGVVWVFLHGSSEVVGYSTSGRLGAGWRLPDLGVAIEDIAIGPGPDSELDYLYFASRANPAIADRRNLSITRFAEPDPSASAPAGLETFEFEYGGRSRDIRALFIDPDSGDIYVVSDGSGPPGVYVAEAPLDPSKVGVFRLLGTISPAVAPVVTGADISPGGDALAIGSSTSVAVWSRHPGQSIADALTASPCLADLDSSEYSGSVAFSGEANRFLTLSPGREPTLFEHRPPLKPFVAVGRAAVAPELGNLAPVVRIDQPESDFTWQVGDTVALAASVDDDQDVDEESYVWRIVAEHCPPEDSCIRRPVAEAIGASTEVPIPKVGLTLPLKLIVTAIYTDPNGLASEAAMDLLPRTSQVSLESNTPGAVVRIGAEQVVMPAIREAAPGDIIDLTVEVLQDIDGVLYAFDGWSDGGDRTHQLVIGEAPLALTLRLVPASSVGPPEVEIKTPANRSTVSGPLVTVSGGASSPLGVNRAMLYVKNLGTNEYWNGSAWVGTWSWFEPTGVDPWTYDVTLTDGSYETIAWAWDSLENISDYVLQTFTVG